MITNFPKLIEDCAFKPHLEAVMSFPQKSPEGAILRTESYQDILERVRRFNIDWVGTGHVRGDNKHNVSCTISLKEDEWEECGCGKIDTTTQVYQYFLMMVEAMFKPLLRIVMNRHSMRCLDF
jgi:hypothetical protein